MRHIVPIALFVGLTSGCVAIPPEKASPFADYKDWYLETELAYQIGDTGQSIVVPVGFVTDYASIPQPLCVFLPMHGRHSRPAIVHDYLYWQGVPQQQADKIMYLAMVEQGVDADTRQTIYNALTKFGKPAWESNQDQRAHAELRVIPAEYLANHKPRATQTWAEYRKQLNDAYPDKPERISLIDSEPQANEAALAAADELFVAWHGQSRPAWWQFWEWFKFWQWC